MRAHVAELRQAGHSISRIAASTGLGRSTIHRYLQGTPELELPAFVVGTSGKRYPSAVARRNGARLNEARRP